MNRLREMILEDVEGQHTPDIAELRYLGTPLYVMLWDDLADLTTFKKVMSGYNSGVDYQRWGNAMTMDPKIPLFNYGQGTTDFVCVEETVELTYVEGLEFETKDVDALPLHGGLYKVNLNALAYLDWHYENGDKTQRVLTDVRTSVNSNVERVFTYFHELESFCDFGEDTDWTYTAKDGLKLAPIDKGQCASIRNTNQKECYRYAL